MIAPARAAVGLALWLALWLPHGIGSHQLGLIDRILLLAPLVIVPLGLRLLDAPHLLRTVEPFCAAPLLVSLHLHTGEIASVLTLPWLAFGIGCALTGFARLLRRGLRPIHELCLDAALLFLPVGCVWLSIARLGANPRDFSDDIVLLTAVHFHYAGFAAMTIAGLSGRRAPTRAFHLAASGVLLGIPLQALGITFSRELEIAAAFLLAVSFLAFATVVVRAVVPTLQDRTARVLIRVSALSLGCAMCLAPLYALRLVEISTMAAIHGVLNSLGFALCGLIGWTRHIDGTGVRLR